ncbi:MAG: hypothetical protein PSV46_17200 [Reyranella sp.]|nr:hypothetical protein [Reyranella sp.]
MSFSTKYGICYSPTWTTWAPPYSNTGANAQFSDADFFNESFQALWNTGSDGTNTYRDDLGTIGGASFNLVRVYDWGPTRGWNSATSVGQAHLDFLNYASANNLQVIVPISNYFLSDDTYAWAGQDPTSDYALDGAPADIQTALQQFLGSVTDPDTGRIHSAVHSFSVGNEIDINTLVGQGVSGVVSPASRLGRIIWWFVNLQAQITANNLGKVLLTSPISNADQGGSGTNPPSYWFQAFVNGVTGGVTPLPQGTQGGTSGTFSANWFGLNDFSWYTEWYYNSVNIYQTGSGLLATVGQYDNWQVNTANNINWPGQQFDVPLLLTEIGVERATPSNSNNQDAQFTAVTQQIAQAIENYLNGNPNTLLAGYCIYEFNDEAYLNANWGIFMSGAPLYEEATGTTQVSYGPWPSTLYPVDQLSPVTYSTTSVTLSAALAKIFTSS